MVWIDEERNSWQKKEKEHIMSVLFKWVVPTDRRKSVSGCEQGKKVRKVFGR